MRPVDILLIEDNSGFITLIEEAFKEGKGPSRIHVVENGEDAMLFLGKKGKFGNVVIPDIILLDLNLPKKDGREVLRDIKMDPMLKHIPVIVLTTSDADQDVSIAYRNYANCYIRKPFNLDQFVEIVNKVEDFWLTTVKLPSSDHARD